MGRLWYFSSAADFSGKKESRAPQPTLSAYACVEWWCVAAGDSAPSTVPSSTVGLVMEAEKEGWERSMSGEERPVCALLCCVAALEKGCSNILHHIEDEFLILLLLLLFLLLGELELP